MRRTSLAVLTATLAATLVGLPGSAVGTPMPVAGGTESVPMGGWDAARRGVLAAAPEVRTVRKVITARRGFSAVGVTWRQSATTGTVSVAVRTRVAAGAAWSAWTESGAEEMDRPGRGGTELVWTGPARIAEIVVTAEGTLPADVRAELIDPGTGPVDQEAAARPGAEPAVEPARRGALAVAKETAVALMQWPRLVKRPLIYTRQQWGADERLRDWDPEWAANLRGATLHHTATPNGYSKAQVPAVLRAIYRFHAVSRDWGDIGYNVIVDRFGRAWEGRYGGMHRATIGAHAGGFNTGTVGIAMLGNNTTAKPTPAQYEMVARIVAWKLGTIGIDPRTKLWFLGGPNTKYKTRVHIPLPVLFPHKATSATSCPGRQGEAALVGLRVRAARIMSASPIKPKPKPKPTPTPSPT